MILSGAQENVLVSFKIRRKNPKYNLAWIIFVYISLAIIYTLYILKGAQEHCSVGLTGVEVDRCGQSCSSHLVSSSSLQGGTQESCHIAHLWLNTASKPLVSPGSATPPAPGPCLGHWVHGNFLFSPVLYWGKPVSLLACRWVWSGLYNVWTNQNTVSPLHQNEFCSESVFITPVCL